MLMTQAHACTTTTATVESALPGVSPHDGVAHVVLSQPAEAIAVLLDPLSALHLATPLPGHVLLCDACSSHRFAASSQDLIIECWPNHFHGIISELNIADQRLRASMQSCAT